MTICQSFTFMLLIFSLPFWQAEFFFAMSEFLRNFALAKEGEGGLEHPL